MLKGALHLWKKCIRLLSYVKRPKFRFENSLPYLAALKNFSIAKKSSIAYAHLVILIFKLRSNGTFNLAVYNYIQGHTMLLLQNFS